MSSAVTSEHLLRDLLALHPKLIDLSLERIAMLLEKLGAPHRKLPPVVHVAGTNGKGSTTAFMRAMLEAGGLSVHTYTSPHLVRFHERIRLAKEAGLSGDITEAKLIDVLQRVIAANDKAAMTFFEMTTAAAFLAFAEHPADVVLLEVGLGGRLDATNMINRPAATVITPISLDHTELLADNIEDIAREKAGIIKPDVPVIIGPQEPAALSVIEEISGRVGAPTLVWGRDYDTYEQNGRLVFQGEDRVLDCRLPELHGRHQIINAGVAIASLLNARPPFELGEAAINTGLSSVRWPARLSRLNSGVLAQIVGEGTEIWLDGGHNPAAGAVLGQFLAELEERAPKPNFLVIGMMQRKDVEGYVAPLQDLAREVIAVPIPGDNPGSLNTTDLADRISAAGLPVCEATSILDALRQITTFEPGAKRIVICGSLYLAGAVLAFDSGDSI